MTSPVASSARMQPALQMSVGVEYRLEPSRISGGRYRRVTTCNDSSSVWEDMLRRAGALCDSLKSRSKPCHHAS